MAELPNIEAEGERIANETWRHPSGMYLWTDHVGAIQTAIAEERARHRTASTAALTAEIQRLRKALLRCADIVQRHNFRQAEKVEDVKHIARAALSTTDTIGGGEAVAWLYEKNGKRSLQLSRQPWNTAPGRDWIETPLYATPQPVSGDAVREALDWFSGQHRLSLEHYSPMYGDDDDQSVEWRVHRESGSINDREWEIVGRGETALAAILAALNHGGTQG